MMGPEYPAIKVRAKPAIGSSMTMLPQVAAMSVMSGFWMVPLVKTREFVRGGGGLQQTPRGMLGHVAGKASISLEKNMPAYYVGVASRVKDR